MCGVYTRGTSLVDGDRTRKREIYTAAGRSLIVIYTRTQYTFMGYFLLLYTLGIQGDSETKPEISRSSRTRFRPTHNLTRTARLFFRTRKPRIHSLSEIVFDAFVRNALNHNPLDWFAGYSAKGSFTNLFLCVFGVSAQSAFGNVRIKTRVLSIEQYADILFERQLVKSGSVEIFPLEKMFFNSFFPDIK